MPWTAADATRHTHKADTPKRQRQWADVANSELAKHGDDARAIRAANSVVAHNVAEKGLANGGRATKRMRPDPAIKLNSDYP